MTHILLQIGFLGIHLASIAFVVEPTVRPADVQTSSGLPSPVSSPLCMSETRLQNREAAFREMMSHRTS